MLRAVSGHRSSKPHPIEDRTLASVCVVRDLTIMGACIEFDANRVGRIHKKFELSFDNFVTGWSCHVIWQFRGSVGVSRACAFLEEKRLTG